MRQKSFLLCLIIGVLCVVLAGCAGNDASAGPPSAQGDDFTLPRESHYEVVVVGGEPEGIAAALAAARSGKKTLLIEEGPALGGLWTLGWLNFFDMNYGPEGELLTRGIFEEFYEALGNGFDIEEAIEYFAEVTQAEPLLDVALNTKLGQPFLRSGSQENPEVEEGPVSQENAILKESPVLYRLDTEMGQQIYGKRFIDATTDADLAAACGVPYTIGGEDYGQPQENQAATLVFRLKNVSWPKIFLYNNTQRLLGKLNPGWGDAQSGAKSDVAWGYGQQALTYQPHDAGIRLRGPNIAKAPNGQVLLNALLIFGVDPLDEESKAAAIKRGQAELPYIIDFLRSSCPGFADAKLDDTAPRLYIRESRHIEGEYRLTITDVLENRDQWDRIALGSYPVDIQPVSPDSLGDVIGKPVKYSIPFRCLVPLGVENLLVVGRSASYDSLAHGSARVVPVGVAAGEAAGVAAGLSLDRKQNFRQLSRDEQAITSLQEELLNRGAYLQEFGEIRNTVMDHWAYGGLVVMRSLGLASGGYNNDYRLDNQAEAWDVQRIFTRVQARISQLEPEAQFGTMALDQAFVSRQDMLKAAADLLRLTKQDTKDDAAALLQQKGLLSQEYINRLQPLDQKPTFAELYWLGAQIYHFYTDELQR
jgi:hypothetical protein